MQSDLRAPTITLKALLRFAVPSTAFVVLTNGYRVVDQYYIQAVSVEAQAAVGTSIFVLIVFFAAFELVAAGASPLIARATGAGDHEARRRVLGTSVAAALLLTEVLMIVGSLGAGTIADLLGLSGRTHDELVRYLTALSLTILPLVFTPLVDHAFLAIGKARAPMVLHGLSLAANIVLTPLFIHGLELGIVGAALASNLARAAATGIGFVVLARQVGLRRAHVRFAAKDELMRVLRVGWPIASSTALYALVYWGMLETSISPLGPHVNAALGIGFSALEGVTWPIFHGLSMAVASFVGRALGAQDIDGARRVVRLAVPLTAGVGLFAALVFGFAGGALVSIFTEDPKVFLAAREYAQVLAFSQLFVAFEALEEGILGGAGDTRAVFWGSVPYNLARIPLAWWAAFGLGMGAAGIWWTINVTTWIKATVKGASVYRGRWLHIQP